MRLERAGDDLVVEAPAYRLTIPAGRGLAYVEGADGSWWAELRLLASVDTLDGRDETLAPGEPAVSEDGSTGAGPIRLTWEQASSRWQRRRLAITALPDVLEVQIEVEGRGLITDVSLLAGRVVLPRSTGFLMSAAWFHTLFCSAPSDPARIVQPAAESASIGAVSGSEPGRGSWFFTPAPFCYAVAKDTAADPLVPPHGPWLWFGLEVAPADADFNAFAWRPSDRAFGFQLDYDGKTAVDGRWRAPRLTIGLAPDPYAAIERHRERLVARGLASRPARSPRGPEAPAWWREPMFCGWGAQGALARAAGRTWAAAPDHATQANYDAFLAALEGRGVVPGTIVIDDKWQLAYGTNEPDPDRWPDLRGWIEDRHRRDQRVLLWYRAWATEGLDPDACVRNALGEPIAIDPTNPDGEAVIRRGVRSMLRADGLDADGLKIDFTARTPSGVATTHHGGAWGVGLLRRLLEIVAGEARSLKPHALLIGHAPNALTAPSLDMLRLNDALRLDDPQIPDDIVAQMRYRAAVVRAACPDHLIDTDDWCMPSLAAWRAYAAIKAELGVPALYYATHIDRTGEAFEDSDYELLRDTWAAYRQREGLPPR